MRNLKNAAGAIGLVIFSMCLPGCANTTPNNTQIITQAMVVPPPKPIPPNPETADQREVAFYIVQLRGWGNAMQIQLKAIELLLKESN